MAYPAAGYPSSSRQWAPKVGVGRCGNQRQGGKGFRVCRRGLAGWTYHVCKAIT